MTGYPIPKPAVKAAIAILRAGLDTKTGVATNIPRIWPRLFVRVTRAGGGQHLLVTDTARVLIECWADSAAACEALTNECRAILRNAQGRRFGDVFIRGFDNEDGPVELPDPDVPDRRRWQFQGDLLVSTS